MIASRRWQDWATTVIGALVGLSPLVFANSWSGTEAWAAYILGGLIFVVGVASLVFTKAFYLEWTQVILAAVLFFSPWLAGFTAVTGMAWMAWSGAAALVLVTATLFQLGGRAVGVKPTTT